MTRAGMVARRGVAAALLVMLAACGQQNTSPAAAPASLPTGGAATATQTAATPAAATPAAASLSVTDPAGKKLTLDEVPERIVCLTGICDDMLVELGLTPTATTTPKLLTRPDYLGAAGAGIPVIPGTFGGEDVAAIAKAEPDLVIGLAGVHDQLRAAVEKFAPLWVVKVKNHEDSIAYLRALAALTGRGQQQAQAEDRFRGKIAQGLAVSREKGLDRVTALAMYGSSSVGVNTTDDVLGAFLDQFFAYPWPSKGGGFETAQAYSIEEILARAPQVIFVQSFAFGGAKPVTETYRDNPVWKRIPAVAAGKVFEVQPELWASGRGTRAFGIILDEAMAKASG
ncbi:iron complex transport system substrate-binding protein [Streptosporangium becharense]|uniref:Iron complex transport system substrate-binding protein n=1 Tax=Streptosporangium becharense TaxID=1816182 RepID=A0A7W9IB16_9ACTN|nr:ABC transporter substrate-binding protein [Streptosporangium becharense]MBB2910752.1 iron complex transport system substrate-binding protein [Streptosporangium becharense]MBB5817447.1 iron complex transport system substrate-binding protein [Streptosporangium becharense]